MRIAASFLTEYTNNGVRLNVPASEVVGDLSRTASGRAPRRAKPADHCKWLAGVLDIENGVTSLRSNMRPTAGHSHSQTWRETMDWVELLKHLISRHAQDQAEHEDLDQFADGTIGRRRHADAVHSKLHAISGMSQATALPIQLSDVAPSPSPASFRPDRRTDI